MPNTKKIKLKTKLSSPANGTKMQSVESEHPAVPAVPTVTGLALVVSLDETCLQDAVGVIARLFSRPKALSYFPAVTNRSVGMLVSGSPSDYVEQAQLLNMYQPKNPQQARLSAVHACPELNPAWLEGAARVELERQISDPRSPEVLIVHMAWSPLESSLAEKLEDVKMQAVAHNKLLVVVGLVEDRQILSTFAKVANDTFLCQLCQADPGHSTAISIANLAWEGSFADGVGKIMVQVKRCIGKFTFDTQPFVDAEVAARIVWYLAVDEMARLAIAAAVPLSVTKVDAYLSRMRPLRPSQRPKNWRARYAGVYSIPLDPDLKSD